MPNNIACGLLVLVAILFVGWIITLLLQCRYRTAELEQVRLRIISWIYIGGVFASLFILPDWSVIFLFCLLAMQSCREIISSFITHMPLSKKRILLLFCSCAVVSASLYGGSILCRRNPNLFFFVVVLTQLNDVFQYIWGKSLGTHTILPAISPAKTWEGFLGGLLTSACVAYGTAPYFVGASGWQAFLLGGALAVGGFAGDVTFSALKRQCKIKDFGTLLPGHGGLSDRIDSLLYVLPVSAIFGL